MKKRLLSLAVAATMLATLFGCTAASSSAPAPSGSAQPASQTEDKSEVVTIKYVGFAESVGAYEARAEEFMELHPNIRVEVQGIAANSWGELMQALTINIAGGDIPDVADIASEGQRAFAASGLIIPLDDYIQRDYDELADTIENIDPKLMETMQYNDATYCMPTVWNDMLLYYNKNVLAEHGIDEPSPDWTIDDFIEICEKVTENNDGVNDTYGYAFANGYFITLVPWMLVHGGNVLNEDWTESTVASPESVAAVEMLHSFVYDYGFSPKLDGGFGDFELFVQDRLAFMGAGMWQVNALRNAEFPVDEYDVIPFPIVKTNDAVIGVGGTPIFAASEHKDEAWEFVKFLSGKDFQESFVVEDGWSIPSVKTAADMLAEKDFAPSNAHLFYESAQNGVMVPAPQEYGTIEEVLLREFSSVMADMKTPQEAMEDAEAEINEAIAQRS